MVNLVVMHELTIRQTRLGSMVKRYPEVICPRCGCKVQNLVRHFRSLHKEHLTDVYRLCEPSSDRQVLELNQKVLLERAGVHRTWKWDLNVEVVYFIQAGLPGRPIKIGYAQELCRRIVSLQLGCPEPLEVLLAVAGGRSLERDLHERFAHLRIHQEWFRVDFELIQHIHDMSQEHPVVPTRKVGALNVYAKNARRVPPKLTYEVWVTTVHGMMVVEYSRSQA